MFNYIQKENINTASKVNNRCELVKEIAVYYLDLRKPHAKKEGY